MDLAIGLPNAVPKTTGAELTEWASRAADRPRDNGAARAAADQHDRAGEAGAQPPRPLRRALLGDEGEQRARDHLLDYYAWLGVETAGMIAASAATDAESVQGYMAAYDGAGCDELFFFPSSSDAAQVDLLADAADL
jgi:hypothetical protein